jgi:hypothetical protein
MPIYHADPWLVKTLIEGGTATSPELFAIWIARGLPMGPPNPNKGLLQDGYLVVNPTDNSLWYYPYRHKPAGG